MDLKKYNKRRQPNIVLNLLQREINSEYITNDSYEHRRHHQHIASIKPNFLTLFNLDTLAPPDTGPPFTRLAQCLGFSPNGTYLAFHNSYRTEITVLKYQGVENRRISNIETKPYDIFHENHTVKLGLAELTREQNYGNDAAHGSWWTDDSSTIIIQLSMAQVIDDEEATVSVEENSLQQANDFVDENRSVPLERNQRDMDRFAARERVVISRPTNVDAHTPPTRTDEDKKKDNETANVFEDMVVQHMDDPEHGLADEKIINKFFSQKSNDEKTSRTMSFHHALASSVFEAYRKMESEENLVTDRGEATRKKQKDDVPPVPSTSGGIYHHQVQSVFLNDQFSKPKESSPHVNAGLSDKLRNEVRLKKISEAPKHIKYRFEKEFKGLLKKYAGFSKQVECGTNCGGAQTRVEPCRKNLERPSVTYADCLRTMVRERQHRNRISIENDNREGKRTIAFIAFNVKKKLSTPLFFKDVDNILCHIRNRKLSVAYNKNLVETYQLNINNEWERDEKFNLSTRISDPFPFSYQFDTMPGLPQRLQHEGSRNLFDYLYDSENFYTPIQQDVAVVLQRDMTHWTSRQFCLIEKFPIITRCHMITDDLLAITMYYDKEAPIQIGVTVSLENMKITVYPDYHEFLQLLFLHHLHDMVPRHWTYLNPHSATQQKWFKEGFADISSSQDMNTFERLNDIYELLSSNWNNVKSAANPLTNSFFNNIDPSVFLSRHIFEEEEGIAQGARSEKCRTISMDQFYHPADPFILINSNNSWMMAALRRDPDDVFLTDY